MNRPHADELIRYMPESVRQEYFATGSGLIGLSKGVENWIRWSTHPFVEGWVRRLKQWAVSELRVALKEQEKMAEYAQLAYAGAKGSIRHRAVIHPVVQGWMETQHGPHTFHDRDAIADTERLQPKLFVNK